MVDGLFAEQIRGCGFEGEDFKTYWESFSDRGSVECVDVEFQNGKKSVRLHVEGGRAGIRQGRIFVDAGHDYDGSLWVKREAGSPQLTLRVVSSKGDPIASVPLAVTGSGWQEVHYSFSSPVRDTQASVEIAAAGSGTLLLDFVSMMRADVRRDGMLRPDLLAGPARSRSALHSLARGLLRFHIQVEGRHRPARLAPLPPQHDLGRLLGLLRLRDGGVPGALPEAQRRAPDRAGRRPAPTPSRFSTPWTGSTT